MLPDDFKKRAKDFIPQATWRLPTIYSLLGNIQVAASKAQSLNDFSTWKKALRLGDDIVKWIESDSDRSECWQKICDEKNSQENFDPFFRKR